MPSYPGQPDSTRAAFLVCSLDDSGQTLEDRSSPGAHGSFHHRLQRFGVDMFPGNRTQREQHFWSAHWTILGKRWRTAQAQAHTARSITGYRDSESICCRGTPKGYSPSVFYWVESAS